ncbi:MAG: hypothetical protein R6U32_01080 [Candidatus Woesearchaeota archaeon]
MKTIDFSFNDSLVKGRNLKSYAKKLEGELTWMNHAAAEGYDDDRASINLPLDRKMLGTVKKAADEKRKLKPDYIVVIGIGGSNLGTIAVQEAVLGKHYNETGPKTKILYAETVDPDSIKRTMDLMEKALKGKKRVILNVVSKSGTTTETMANFQVLLGLLRKHRKDYAKYVVATTDRDSKLWKLAQKEGFTALEIPERVGGRYSVFSPVGLFPLAMLGLDIERLLKGAASMRKRCLEKNIEDNPAAMSAALAYHHNRKKRNINVMFVFSKDLEAVDRWYRQLMGESTGKRYNTKGKKVFEGLTPFVAVGSTDLHSVGQLFLGGPDDKFITFVDVNRSNNDVKVPRIKECAHLVENIQGRGLDEMMKAILKGVQASFRNDRRPFIDVVLPDKSEESIGQFLQYKMMEMMYLCRLLNVNPFDQPNVEDYKKETRKILAGGRQDRS